MADFHLRSLISTIAPKEPKKRKVNIGIVIDVDLLSALALFVFKSPLGYIHRIYYLLCGRWTLFDMNIIITMIPIMPTITLVIVYYLVFFMVTPD